MEISSKSRCYTRRAAMDLSVGDRLGRFEILGPLGAGGMGDVYRARDPQLQREVAIKVLPAAFSSDPDRQRRFEQEARAAGSLNHPNIVAVHDVGVHEGSLFIVTELLEGQTLRQRMDGRPLAPRTAAAYAIGIAGGLAGTGARTPHRPPVGYLQRRRGPVRDDRGMSAVPARHHSRHRQRDSERRAA